jgi:selenide,water dikinase
MGGGHTHALLLLQLIQRPLALGKPSRREIVLISPYDRSPYSGMLSGAIAGVYSSDDIFINLKQLAKAAHIKFRRDSITYLDPENQIVVLQSGEQIRYDLLSLNCGATPSTDITGSADWSDGIKPIETFISRMAELESERETARVAILGGGTTGCEVAASLSARWKSLGKKFDLTIIEESTVVASIECRGLAKAVRAHLENIGVQLITDATITNIEPNLVYIQKHDERQTFEFDWILRCTPPQAPSWLRDSGLELSPRGFVVHDSYLTTSFKNILACGDMAVNPAAPSPRAGVYAVRQAPFLLHNLRHLLQLEFDPKKYVPQPSFLCPR